MLPKWEARAAAATCEMETLRCPSTERLAQRDLRRQRWPRGSFHEHAAQLPTVGHAVRHEIGKWGALLRFSERDGPQIAQTTSDRLNLFTFRRRELERLGWDRLIKADRERGDLVEGLRVADRGDRQQHSAFLVNLELVVLGTGTEFVELVLKPAVAWIVWTGSGVSCYGGSARHLGVANHAKTQPN
jgi:hypothetical protein